MSELEKICNKEIDAISFPYGAFDRHIVKFAQDSGYRFIFTSLPFLYEPKDINSVIGRINAEPSDYILETWLKINGCYRWLPVAIAFKRRLKTVLGLK